jgi:hypothetical protein
LSSLPIFALADDKGITLYPIAMDLLGSVPITETPWLILQIGRIGIKVGKTDSGEKNLRGVLVIFA